MLTMIWARRCASRWVLAALALLCACTIATAQTTLSPPAGSAGHTDVIPLIDMIIPYVAMPATALVLWLLGTAVSAWNRFAAAHKELAFLQIDQAHRDTLTAFANRAAASLVADGKVQIDGMKITVDQTALAALVKMAPVLIQEAQAHFGLTPQMVSDRVIDALPHVPAVAAAQAASVSVPSAAVSAPAK